VWQGSAGDRRSYADQHPLSEVYEGIWADGFMADMQLELPILEDSFPDVGKKEMEARFSERRDLFLRIYDPERPRESLPRYMNEAQRNEAYRYKPVVSSGPASLFLGGSVPTKGMRKGELPECQLLGFVHGNQMVGCLAHPLAETSQGYDGRDQVGFFHHTGCCSRVGCEASKEFKFLSPSTMKLFDKIVDGLSWYEYSRHAISVGVYYLRSYDYLLQKLDEKDLLDGLTLAQLVAFTNAFYDEWPMRNPDSIHGRENGPGTRWISWPHRAHPPSTHNADCMNTLDLLLTDIPLAERILYVALDAWFLREHFAVQLTQARDYIERRLEALRNA
jgi:hypothetical protein